MTKDTLEITDITDLDDLFSQARAEQPLLPETKADENFTKIVINRLPNKVSRFEKRGFSFDLLGMILGLIAVSLIVEPAQLLSSVLSIVPESLTLSPMTLMLGALGGLGLSLGAWWAVEKVA